MARDWYVDGISSRRIEPADAFVLPRTRASREMKAAIFRQHGGPEVLEYTDVPEPRIRANEVLVEVKACALNHLDIFVRNGLQGIEIPLPHILGCDVAGGAGGGGGGGAGGEA